jgi:hypothetical protein
VNKYLRKINLVINTIKYLKITQVKYRFYYLIRKEFRYLTSFKYPLSKKSKSNTIQLLPSIYSRTSYHEMNFEFLNLNHTFQTEVDWNFSDFGKLWTYNLTYFDFLQQIEMNKQIGLYLINDFIDKAHQHKDAMEPYPISLRSINWIKFISTHHITERKIDDSLYAQYDILYDSLEYHLLGNHLLENAFSLLFGAYYFNDNKLYEKAKEILTLELSEQILNDGGHFELSPMYHQIMLFRILDCINLLQKNPNFFQENILKDLLENKAFKMLDWLNKITFKNGNIPLFNDSAYGIAPTTSELNQYAVALQLRSDSYFDSKSHNTSYNVLNNSGYRIRKTKKYEIIVDIGNIGPNYIPGHAHSDTFNFELYLYESPFIVDTGTSTYETNDQRNIERSTISHNTVEINGENQSEVWGSFRVAKRAFVIDLYEDKNSIRAIHDGYLHRSGVLHQREFQFDEKYIMIIDNIISTKKHKAVARVHFHPDIDELMIKNHISCSENDYIIKEYEYAPEFNKRSTAKMLEIAFNKRLEMKINI